MKMKEVNTGYRFDEHTVFDCEYGDVKVKYTKAPIETKNVGVKILDGAYKDVMFIINTLQVSGECEDNPNEFMLDVEFETYHHDKIQIEKDEGYHQVVSAICTDILTRAVGVMERAEANGQSGTSNTQEPAE
jgi:hypothetical protein